MLMISEALTRKFWSKVDKSPDACGCWRWTGSTTRRGYGVFDGAAVGQKKMGAHRFSFLLKTAQLDAEREVCHTCDNPSCVNPDHLWQGTHQQNICDGIAKGRMVIGRVGEASCHARLTAEQVRAIRVRLAAGGVQRRIAEDFGITYQHLSDIKNGHRWKSLDRCLPVADGQPF